MEKDRKMKIIKSKTSWENKNTSDRGVILRPGGQSILHFYNWTYYV